MENKRMELGSEYGLDLSGLSVCSDNLNSYLNQFHDVYYYDSGRSVIREFVKLLSDDETILLPEFICESVTDCFRSKDIKFYRILPDFSIDIEDVKNKMHSPGGVFFLMHYFGKLQPSFALAEIRRMADQYGYTILEDTTHSFFSAAETVGDYMVCSIRKWIPVSLGGVLYVRNGTRGLPPYLNKKSTDNERLAGFVLKDRFLNHGLDCNAEYRRIFSECESRLDQKTETCKMSDLNRFLMDCFEVNRIMKRRKENAALLRRLLSPVVDVISFAPEECPFGIPLRIRERDTFREYLNEKRVYCAVHWPFDGLLPEERPQAKENADALITLPIDQRYSEKHMEYLADLIRKYGGQLSF